MERTRAVTVPRVCAALLVSLLVAAPVALYAQETGPPPAGSAAGPRFTLSGVVIVSDEIAMALLAEPGLTQGQPVMLKKGDQIGAFRLVQVLPDRVVLQAGGQELTVALASGGTAAGPPAPAPAAGPVIPGVPVAPLAPSPPAAFPPPESGNALGQAFQDAIRKLGETVRPAP